MRLQGKVAIITGAGSGMGRAMANLFAKEGAKIVAGEWNEKSLAEVVAEVKAAGGEITGVKGNIAVQAEAEAIVDAALNTFGRLDIVVNNAGVMDVNQGVGEVTNEMWERVIGINLNGTMFVTRHAMPALLKQGGSIINIASNAALGGGAAGVAYTASKHAVLGLTRSTAWIYGQKGVRCNAILPGGVATNIIQSVDMTKFDRTGSARTKVYTDIMPGLLQGTDIANLALFLASDESKLINGTAITADAGWRAA